MNLAGVGVIAQIVGTAAIIVSLFYLAAQVRHNARAARSATYQALVAHIATIGRLFIDDPELGSLFAASPEELRGMPPEVQGRFGAAAGFILRHYDSVYYQYLNGALEEDQWYGLRHRLRDFLSLPSVAAWWQESRGAFSRKFAAHVDSELERLGVADDAA